jgi:hypothetical protein
VSENGGSEHDRLTRLLREQGPAKAPPGMAGDVMRRVRAESRPAPHSRWRPAAVFAAAAIAIIAAVLGISRIGTGTSSSGSEAAAGGSVANTQAPATAPNVTRSAGNAGAAKSAPVYKRVSPTALRAAFSVNLPACAGKQSYTLHVPAAQLDTAARNLQALARAQNGITIRVAGDATAGRHLTCP